MNVCVLVYTEGECVSALADKKKISGCGGAFTATREEHDSALNRAGTGG
jgi:hypothetical protein